MDNREKLIELDREATDHATDICLDHRDCEDCPGRKYGTHCRDYLKADHLIAHGVTVQKWIPVTERLPEEGKEVIVYSGGCLKPTVYAYSFWNKCYDSWARITHWMPLPEAPIVSG